MYKDTAKWLLAFVPIPTLAALAFGLAPRFAAIQDLGVARWVCEFPLALGAVAVTLVATVVIIVMCCKVLLTQSTEWPQLRDDGPWLEKAFSKHAVGLPLFGSLQAYNNAKTQVLDEPSDPEVRAIADTNRRILDLSEAINTRERFKSFGIAYAICTILIFAGVLVVAALEPEAPSPVTQPTRVSILMPPGTENRFVAATGCTSLEGTEAIVVGGLWSRPKVRLIGQGCPTGDWTPPANLNVVIASPPPTPVPPPPRPSPIAILCAGWCAPSPTSDPPVTNGRG